MYICKLFWIDSGQHKEAFYLLITYLISSGLFILIAAGLKVRDIVTDRDTNVAKMLQERETGNIEGPQDNGTYGSSPRGDHTLPWLVFGFPPFETSCPL